MTAVRHLLAAAADAPSDPDAQRAAADEIARLGPDAIPDLRDVLLADGRNSRRAALGLASLGTAGVQALRDAAASGSDRVRGLAREALAAEGGDEAVETLVRELLSGADRLQAAQTLGTLADPHPQAVAALREAATRTEKDVAGAARESLARLER